MRRRMRRKRRRMRRMRRKRRRMRRRMRRKRRRMRRKRRRMRRGKDMEEEQVREQLKGHIEVKGGLPDKEERRRF
ncbi:hypothetical protein NHX12_023989 [Muraenolepis orangiensis]|uniref:Uncharacterized protein n=1 Tax=Muraenolepis orangiensis TaxID=630683 RepID=A0A9Q0EPN9_9TELE|nr:hypothetical protein NHX12_023989 [Muraenolepis orangiensis]